MKRSADGTFSGPGYNLRKTRKPSSPLKDPNLSDNLALIAHAVSLDHKYSSKSGSSHSTTHKQLKGIKLENHILKNAAVIPELSPVHSNTQTPAHLLAHAVHLDHNYISKSDSSHSTTHEQLKDINLENHFYKNAAVIPEFCPEFTKSHTEAHLVHTSPEEQLLIHGNSTEDHQRTYHAVVDSMLKKSSGEPHNYSLQLGLRVKQRLWKTLNCPTMIEEEQPDGLIQVKEMFSRPSLKRSAPRINVDISGEPLPYTPQRKRPCL
ncbi:uncharacterized protein LOC130414528 [Triplophysa dalaica]|uniref:uncharacterized protein LOC130414528 n=1 Tax=Triplophysa dalaica TaxID=1582913 RepID=UPI0024DF9D4D|nr:uncharacterized protein LOC130414528 [Triplophysa dalaica]